MTHRAGGCRCGALRYSMAGEPIGVNCCHCRDCQTLSGSAFALNAMIEVDRLQLTQGEPVGEVGDPGAVRCGACGVMLWAFHPMMGDRVAFLRVGTLDAGEDIAPDAHFFIRSKHAWVTIPEGVRSYESFPQPNDPPMLDAPGQARLAAAMGQS